MRRFYVAIVICVLLVVVGIYLLQQESIVPKAAAAPVWSLLVPSFLWGLRYENEYRTKIEKALHIYEPLIGFPDYQKDGVKHYNSRAGIPNFETLLSIKNLKRIEVFGITCYLLVLTYRDEIRVAASRKVKFTFYILDPTDKAVVDAQKTNYRDRDIKKQIEDTMEDLRKIGGVTVHNYSGSIAYGIMILEFSDKDKLWMKVESIVPDVGANSRHNMNWFKKDNENEFDRYLGYLKDKTS